MYMGLSNFQTLSKAVYLQVATTSDTYVRGMGKSNNNSQDILKTSQRWELTYERERCLLHLELFFFVIKKTIVANSKWIYCGKKKYTFFHELINSVYHK